MVFSFVLGINVVVFFLSTMLKGLGACNGCAYALDKTEDLSIRAYCYYLGSEYRAARRSPVMIMMIVNHAQAHNGCVQYTRMQNYMRNNANIFYNKCRISATNKIVVACSVDCGH